MSAPHLTRLARRPFREAVCHVLGFTPDTDDAEILATIAVLLQIAKTAEPATATAIAPLPEPEPEPELSHIEPDMPAAVAALARLTTGPRPGHACTPPATRPGGARWTCGDCQQPWKVRRGMWEPA